MRIYDMDNVSLKRFSLMTAPRSDKRRCNSECRRNSLSATFPIAPIRQSDTICLLSLLRFTSLSREDSLCAGRAHSERFLDDSRSPDWWSTVVVVRQFVMIVNCLDKETTDVIYGASLSALRSLTPSGKQQLRRWDAAIVSCCYQFDRYIGGCAVLSWVFVRAVENRINERKQRRPIYQTLPTIWFD